MAEGDERTQRELARRILAEEDRALDDPAEVAGAVASVLERLYERLRRLVGTGGFEILLLRSTMLAGRDHPDLRELPIPRRGAPSADDVRPCLGSGGASAAEAAAGLVAELLAFLTRLIGPALTWVILREIWPDLPPDLGTSMLDASESSSHEG